MHITLLMRIASSPTSTATTHINVHTHQRLQLHSPCTRARSCGESRLAYELPAFGVRMPFRPTDFTQVNPHINAALVGRALRLLAVQPHERVIDWFCGLGNFTLPLATQAAQVLGIEGSDVLVARAQQNFERNRVEAPVGRALAATNFVARDLFEMTPAMLVADGRARFDELTKQRQQLPPRIQALYARWEELESRRDAKR